MEKCSNCDVFVSSQHKRCPLCSRPVENHGDSLTAYPDYAVLYRRGKGTLAVKIYLFLTISAIVITVCINLFTLPLNPRPWSLLVVSALLYAWLTVRNTILSMMNAGAKILVQLAALSLFLLLIDLLSGFAKWSVNFVIPFLSLSATLLITLSALCKKALWQDYMGYLLAAFLVSLWPIFLLVLRLSSVLWASCVSAIFSLIAIIGLLIFADRRFKDEIKKRLTM
jgi:hypothetical protein